MKYTALHIPPHEHPKPVKLGDSLKDMQAAVGGMIELLPIADFGGLQYDMLLNEEGKLLGLEPNRRVGDVDVLVGDCYIVAYDEEGNLTSIPPYMLDVFTTLYYEPDDDITQEEVEAAMHIDVIWE